MVRDGGVIEQTVSGCGDVRKGRGESTFFTSARLKSRVRGVNSNKQKEEFGKWYGKLRTEKAQQNMVPEGGNATIHH